MNGNYGSLLNLTEEVDRMDQNKEDLIVPNQNLRMVDDNFFFIKGKFNYQLNDLAHSQVAEKLGIPKEYYDRMSSIPELRQKNVNAWLNNSQDKHLVRILDGKVRAFLSDRFKPIDNIFLLHAFLPVVKEMNLRIKSSSITERKMYIQVVFPEIQGEVEKEDIVQFGITFSNSEVGCGAVNIKQLVWRLICSNGLIGENVVRKYHVGRRIGNDLEDYSIYDNKAIMAELESFQERIRCILQKTITQSNFDNELIQMRKTAGQPVKMITDTVENVTKKFPLTKEDGKKIINNMMNEKSTRWGLVNSITALAHEIDNQDKQFEVEKIGNEVLTLSDKEWEGIAV